MSEQAAESTAAVATEAVEAQPAAQPDVTPVETAQPVEQVTPTPEPQEPPRSPREAKERARQAIRQAGRTEDEVVTDSEAATAAEQPRDDKGRYTSPDDSLPSEVADSSEGSDADSGTEQAVDGPPEGMVRIELEDGHPLRDQGKSYLDVPAAEERTYRELANGAARRAAVDAAERRAAEAERRALQVEAEAKWWQESGVSQFGPEFQQQYRDTLETYGEEAAELLKLGAQARAREAINERQADATRSYEATRLQSQANQFRQQQTAALLQRMPGVSPATLDKAFEAYGYSLMVRGQQGQPVQINEQDFYETALPYLQKDPAVMKQFESRVESRRRQEAEKAAEAARKQAQEERDKAEAGRLRDAASRRATNPLGSIGGQTGAATGAGQPAPIDTSTAGSPKQAKELYKRRVLGA